VGIYDTIYKERKSDDPFYTDLIVVLACYASQAEHDLSFNITLDLMDIDAVDHLFTETTAIGVPERDIHLRWYEHFDLKAVEVMKPGRYSLSVLIDKQEKHTIPLWIISPMGMNWDDKAGTETKFWTEDFEQLKDEGRI